MPGNQTGGEPDRSRRAARIVHSMIPVRGAVHYLPATMPSIQSLMVPDTEAQ